MHSNIPVVDHQNSSASFVGKGKFADSFLILVMHLPPRLTVSLNMTVCSAGFRMAKSYEVLVVTTPTDHAAGELSCSFSGRLYTAHDIQIHGRILYFMVQHVEVTFGSHQEDSDCNSVPSLLVKECVSNVLLVSPGSYIQKIAELISRN